ncbi:MAG: peptidylprolyl isomerase [bacterium]
MTPEDTARSRPLSETETTDPNDIIARVNSSVITRINVDEEQGKLLQQLQGRVPPEQLDQIGPQVWKQALENIINFKLLVEESERENIAADAQDVAAHLSQISGRFATPEKFQEQLAAMGLSEETLRSQIEESLRINALLEQHTESASVIDDQAVQEFYRDNSESFQTPERIKASHILIAVDPNDGPEAREQKRQQLANLAEELKKGADFSQLAREHSDCPSKSRGGDLGFFERGRMVKPFEDAAFQLKVGEVSGIVETDFGYHLIKLTKREESSQQPLKEVRGKIETLLKQQKRNQAITDYLTTLRNKANIVYAEGFQPEQQQMQ